MTTANDQIACPECGYGWNEFTHGFHYTHCSKVAHLNHEQITYQCPNCGQVDSHTDECPSNPQRYEHDAPAAPERGEWASVPYSASEVEVIGPKELHVCFLPNTPRGKQIANQIATEHNQHSTLIAQRERLIDAVRDIAIRSLRYCEEKYDHDNQARLNLEALLEAITTSEQKGRR